jgi:dethiobiotin synthetase
MPRLVVLGTGTNVGKTYVATALLSRLRERGVDTLGLKPIETGLPTRDTAPRNGSDAHALEAVSSLPAPRPHPLFGFAEPISPHLAARRANVEPSVASVAQWVHDATIHHITVWTCVETAGGALSPLSATATNADLAAALAPAVLVLVAPDSLGVLHDVSATLAALRSRDCKPDYVVLTQARPPDASTGTNADELRRLGIADPIAVLPASDASALDALVAALLDG